MATVGVKGLKYIKTTRTSSSYQVLEISVTLKSNQYVGDLFMASLTGQVQSC